MKQYLLFAAGLGVGLTIYEFFIGDANEVDWLRIAFVVIFSMALFGVARLIKNYNAK